MLKLYLLRHAKSSWDDMNQADFDRPLNKRGRQAAPVMGSVLKKKGIKPDLILCSPARRTRETLDLVVDAARLKSPVSFEEHIYEASLGELRRLLRGQKEDRQSILLIGHNPGMANLLSDLTGEYEHFPTAALACISLGIESWRDLEPGTGSLDWILRPKELPD